VLHHLHAIFKSDILVLIVVLFYTNCQAVLIGSRQHIHGQSHHSLSWFPNNLSRIIEGLYYFYLYLLNQIPLPMHLPNKDLFSMLLLIHSLYTLLLSFNTCRFFSSQFVLVSVLVQMNVVFYEFSELNSISYRSSQAQQFIIIYLQYFIFVLFKLQH